jgi:hypothetical protein
VTKRYKDSFWIVFCGGNLELLCVEEGCIPDLVPIFRETRLGQEILLTPIGDGPVE